jgi:hypothetical protein
MVSRRGKIATDSRENTGAEIGDNPEAVPSVAFAP